MVPRFRHKSLKQALPLPPSSSPSRGRRPPTSRSPPSCPRQHNRRPSAPGQMFFRPIVDSFHGPGGGGRPIVDRFHGPGNGGRPIVDRFQGPLSGGRRSIPKRLNVDI